MTRFDGFMKQARKKRETEDNLDAQTSKHSDAEMSNKPSIQTSKHPDAQNSSAKSKSKEHVRTTIYLTKALHKRLKIEALEHDDLDMSDITEQAITKWLDEQR